MSDLAEATNHAATRSDRQAAREVIAGLLRAHDEAQRLDGTEHHDGNRYETAGLIYSAFANPETFREPRDVPSA